MLVWREKYFCLWSSLMKDEEIAGVIQIKRPPPLKKGHPLFWSLYSSSKMKSWKVYTWGIKFYLLTLWISPCKVLLTQRFGKYRIYGKNEIESDRYYDKNWKKIKCSPLTFQKIYNKIEVFWKKKVNVDNFPNHAPIFGYCTHCNTWRRHPLFSVRYGALNVLNYIVYAHISYCLQTG